MQPYFAVAALAASEVASNSKIAVYGYFTWQPAKRMAPSASSSVGSTAG